MEQSWSFPANSSRRHHSSSLSTPPPPYFLGSCRLFAQPDCWAHKPGCAKKFSRGPLPCPPLPRPQSEPPSRRAGLVNSQGKRSVLVTSFRTAKPRHLLVQASGVLWKPAKKEFNPDHFVARLMQSGKNFIATGLTRSQVDHNKAHFAEKSKGNFPPPL